jgi:dTMP kinase
MGVFIVLDGMDGSGKSEVVKLLHNYLYTKHKSYKILTTREPTNGAYGRKIRAILSEDKDPKANARNLLEMFIRDREDHLNNIIIPFLEKSDGNTHIVICDRYYYSTIAFQATQGVDTQILIDKNKKFPKPNIAFILDVNPKIALDRIKYREKEKFEKLEFMNDLRKNFLELPKLLEDNIKIIDASKDISEVFETVKKEVDKVL